MTPWFPEGKYAFLVPQPLLVSLGESPAPFLLPFSSSLTVLWTSFWTLLKLVTVLGIEMLRTCLGHSPCPWILLGWGAGRGGVLSPQKLPAWSVETRLSCEMTWGSHWVT